jgi:hypothetical protein
LQILHQLDCLNFLNLLIFEFNRQPFRGHDKVPTTSEMRRGDWLLTFAVVSCGVALGVAVPSLQAPYAPWAHSHFVWLVAFESNQANTTSLVASYQQHNITVGAIDLDSGWSTGYNNFIVDPSKFADMGSLIAGLHSQGIYTILWATSMVDTDSSNYDEGLAQGYYLRDAFNKTAKVKWWHGEGSFIDYSSPQALQWWQQQELLVLNLGVDGWKLDGSECAPARRMLTAHDLHHALHMFHFPSFVPQPTLMSRSS